MCDTEFYLWQYTHALGEGGRESFDITQKRKLKKKRISLEN
jgi:hypothetical protein